MAFLFLWPRLCSSQYFLFTSLRLPHLASNWSPFHDVGSLPFGDTAAAACLPLLYVTLHSSATFLIKAQANTIGAQPCARFTGQPAITLHASLLFISIIWPHCLWWYIYIYSLVIIFFRLFSDETFRRPGCFHGIFRYIFIGSTLIFFLFSLLLYITFISRWYIIYYSYL